MTKRLDTYKSHHTNYLNDCRDEYGYGYKVRVKAVAVPRKQKSSLFAQFITLTIFATLVLFSINATHRAEIMDGVQALSDVGALRGVLEPKRNFGMF